MCHEAARTKFDSRNLAYLVKVPLGTLAGIYLYSEAIYLLSKDSVVQKIVDFLGMPVGAFG
jgi:hypothetical protein